MASKGLMSILFLISLAASSWADETCQATGGCMDEGDELAAIQMANDPASAGKKKTAAAALQVDASCMNVGDKCGHWGNALYAGCCAGQGSCIKGYCGYSAGGGGGSCKSVGDKCGQWAVNEGDCCAGQGGCIKGYCGYY
mmetsp:Transcript_120898/g.270154  ORF Transcript_120898/g.270154 Transcript_120898/m.270154 type:complete len:140 (+) Transcript_120898:73-492(+)